jgi:site-specific DNA-methyltransferase (adenine-specific)
MLELYNKDNLELLNDLPANHIQLIYCDCLYGTGKKFRDFQDLKPDKEVIYQHYVPRIKEMHRVLSETGTIYLQMDYRISHWIRCIMDDVFGYNNFLNYIIWSYNVGGIDKKHFSKKHDQILVYSKSKDFVFNTEDIRVPYKSVVNLNTTKRQLISPEKYKRGKIPTNVWDDCNFSLHNKREYNTQKPLSLLRRIVKASSNEGDLVGDFYMGSCTTGEVCKELNRDFIGCDIGLKAYEIARRKLGNDKSF